MVMMDPGKIPAMADSSLHPRCYSRGKGLARKIHGSRSSPSAIQNTSGEVCAGLLVPSACYNDELWWREVGGKPFLYDNYFRNHQVIFLPTPPMQVFDLYQWHTGQALEEAVRDRFHGDAQVALLTLGRGPPTAWSRGLSWDGNLRP